MSTSQKRSISATQPLIVTVALFFFLGGCGQEEMQKLCSKNEALRREIPELEKTADERNLKLAEKHFDQGLAYIKKTICPGHLWFHQGYGDKSRACWGIL